MACESGPCSCLCPLQACGSYSARTLPQAGSTVAAVRSAMAVVAPGGLVSVLAYVGHEGAAWDSRARKAARVTACQQRTCFADKSAL